jgi:acetyl esterase/lipase
VRRLARPGTSTAGDQRCQKDRPIVQHFGQKIRGRVYRPADDRNHETITPLVTEKDQTVIT